MKEQKIILSEKEPDKQFLWLHYRDNYLTLERFGSKGWEPISKDTSVSWGSISDKPSTFTPSAHKHEISDVNNLQNTLNTLSTKADKIIIDGEGNKVLSDNGSYITIVPIEQNVQEISEAAVTLDPKEDIIYNCTTPVTSLTLNSIPDSTTLSIIRFTVGAEAAQFSYPEGTKIAGYASLVANTTYSIFIWGGTLTIVSYGE